MEIPLLTDILIVLSFSSLTIFLFRKLNLPSILGFLLTGLLVGPKGLSLISAVHEVEVMAEIGIILLLFVIGVEFKLKNLLAIKNTVLIGGTIQVGLSVLSVFLLAFYWGMPWNHALFLGFLFSLSSTAIVLSLLQKRAEVNSPQGKVSLAILIFQDIIVVLMMLLTPIIAGKSENALQTLLFIIVKAAAVVTLLLVSARSIVPRILHEIAKAGRETFFLAVVVICFAVAWATSAIGLSLALGAFMAGLTISESEYSYEATGTILPLKELFNSFFFISIGMLLDIGFLIQNIWMVVLLTLGISLLKAVIASVAAFVLKYPARPVILTGLILFQIGEFSFVLSKTGMQYELIGENVYQYFLAVSILSMAITPFVVQYQNGIYKFISKLFFHKWLLKSDHNHTTYHKAEKKLENHILIIGFGLNGRNVARAAKFANIPYAIIEMNAVTVRNERAKGEPIYYGDASTNTHLIEHLNVYKARVVVIAVSDALATRKIITNIRSLSEVVYIIVRTRFITETDELHKIGANEVIPEEFETSIEVFSRVLGRYLIPKDEIGRFVQIIRSANYEMLRPHTLTENKFLPMNLPEFNVVCLKVDSRQNQIINQKIGEAKIRSRFHLNVLAIQRSTEYIYEITPETMIKEGDILCLMGKPEHISSFEETVR
jgi:monovalent cation:H+ antiporter-2, CPA2 family